jgi:hypothetical protein
MDWEATHVSILAEEGDSMDYSRAFGALIISPQALSEMLKCR